MKPNLCPDWPFMPNDWLSSTKVSAMTPAEAAAYHFILCHAWNDYDCCVPADDVTLARLSRLGPEWGKAKEKVLACFQSDPQRPGHIYNAVQRDCRNAQVKRQHEAREHGKRAAKARWKQSKIEQCPSIPRAVPNGMPKNASSPVAPTEQRRETDAKSGSTARPNDRSLAALGAALAETKTTPRVPLVSIEQVFAYTAGKFKTATVEKLYAERLRNGKWFNEDYCDNQNWTLDFEVDCDMEEGGQ